MKIRHRWLGIVLLVSGTGILIADSAWAQVSPERLAGLEPIMQLARAFVDRMPEPAKRALSSGARNLVNLAERWPHLEELLLQRPAPSGAAPALHGEDGEEEASGPLTIAPPGTQVNVPSTDVDFSPFAGFTQSETSTAWCGKSVVVGWNDSGSFFQSGGRSLNGYSRSTNRGRTFTDLGFLPAPSGLLSGDPVIGCTDEQTFYYASLFEKATTSDISVSKSTDGGFSWAPPISAVSKPSGSPESPLHFLDKPWMAVDPTNPQRIYVTYTDFDDTETRCVGAGNERLAIEVVNSTDGGTTWSSPVVVREVCQDTSGTGSIVQASQVVVDSHGNVFVVWEEFETSRKSFMPGTEVIKSSKSKDKGANWSPPVMVASVSHPVGEFGPFGLFQGAFRNQEFPALAVDRSGGETNGNLYVAWNEGTLCFPDLLPRGGTYCYADIMATRSTDGGATWSTPERVNQNTEPLESGLGTDQFMPGIAVDKNGTVAICFYDRRNDPRNFLIGRTCGTKVGEAFSEIPIATDGWPAVVSQDFLSNPTYMGDYDSVASDFLQKRGGFIGAFGENSKGEPNVRAKKF